jgi:hypothetical protein
MPSFNYLNVLNDQVNLDNLNSDEVPPAGLELYDGGPDDQDADGNNYYYMPVGALGGVNNGRGP